MKSRQSILLVISFILALIVGGFGSALSKSIVLDPQLNRLGLSGVARDGWMEASSQIDLSKFHSGVSSLSFLFDPWRPRGQEPAQISLTACDNKIVVKPSRAENPRVILSIPEHCNSGLVDIAVLNPFKSPDGRLLGVKLLDLRVNYNLLKILDFDLLAIAASLTLFFLFISLFLLRLPALVFVAALLGFSALALVSMNYLSWDNQWQLLCLAVTLSLFVLGLNSVFSFRARPLPAAFDSFINPLWVVALSGVFISGALIRFYGTDFGLPNHYHPDEPRKAAIAYRMVMLGDFDPNYFLHPTLLIYLAALYGKIGNLLGFFGELNVKSMNLAGRLVSATAGSLSVIILYFIAKELFNKRVGILAAALFAFAPLSVTCSRYFKEDALLTFFVLLTTLLCLRAIRKDKPRELLLAGFVAGLASSSKYSGVLSSVAILLTPWLKSGSLLPDKRFFIWGAASAIFVPVGFILASPYVILNFEKFSDHLFAEQEHMISGHHKVVISSWSQYWMYHLSRSILPALTWPATAVGVLGFGMLLRSCGIKGLYVFALFLAFYLPVEGVNAKPPPQPERYILPCLPFIILAAAFAINNLKDKGYKFLAVGLTFIVLAFPVYRSLGLASEIKDDTRVMMSKWVTENIPHGSKIVIDAQAYSAFLPQDKFVIEPMWSIPQRRAMTLENLKAAGVDYILLTNKSYERYFLTQSADQVIRARFQEIFDSWVAVKEFKSDFGNYGFSNPVLSLYKVQLKEAPADSK